ncbi:MAG: MarR family transcriptional regulator [Armatimonadota bacterium]|nr:MarR family transcriptional regulator [Armatimonadota bacterium]
METISAVHRAIRREMRRARPGEISMQQFRALGIIAHHPGASLSLVAQHLGLTTASVSRLVDGLVKSGLVDRADAPEDRRKLVLTLTEKGLAVLETTKSSALGRLARMLMQLSESELSAVSEAMAALRRVVDKMERSQEEAEGAC